MPPQWEDDDGEIDEDALARLEEMQRQKIMDLIGFDMEEQDQQRRKFKAQKKMMLKTANVAAPGKRATPGDESSSVKPAVRTRSAHQDKVDDDPPPDGRPKKNSSLTLPAASFKGTLTSTARAEKPLCAVAPESAQGTSPQVSRNSNSADGSSAAVHRKVRGKGEFQGTAKFQVVESVPQMSRTEQDRQRAAELAAERRAFMSSHVKNVSMFGGGVKKEEELRGRKRQGLGDDAREFVSAQRIVAELGATTFWGKQKKEWEARKLQELGAKKAKKEKVPYNILMGRLKKQGEREEKRKLAEKQAGLAPTKANKKSKSRRVDSHAMSGVMRVKDPTRGVTAAASFKSQGGVARRRH